MPFYAPLVVSLSMSTTARSVLARTGPTSSRRDEATTGEGSLGRSDWLALAVWVGLILIGHLWVGRANESHETKLLAPPLFGDFDLRLSWRVLPAAAFALAVVMLGPRLARRLTWRGALLYSVAGLALWAVALSFVDGADVDGSAAQLQRLPRQPPGRGVPARLLEHLRPNPRELLHSRPGPSARHDLASGGTRPRVWEAPRAAALVIGVGASASAAALVAVRNLAGEDRARACAPFLVLVPAAVWVATSADALFMGVSAWGVALMVVATSRSDHAGDLCAVGGGALLGAGLFLSYGIAPLGAVVLAVALARRRVRPLLIGAAAVIIVVALFAAGGFWWWDGLASTLERYRVGVARNRPLAPFFVSNLAALALVLGPAFAVALVRLKDARVWLLCGTAVLSVVLADLSGLSKGEVERIWLPFVPWLIVATSVLAARRRRWLLGAQALTALVLQVGVRSPW